MSNKEESEAFSKKEKIGLFFVLLVFLFPFFFVFPKKFEENKNKFYLYNEICKESVIQVQINQHLLNLEVACTIEQITQGLMHRNALDENDGMIFVFDKEQVLNFWMKNTFIDLDIAFALNDNIKTIKSMKALDETTVSSDVPSNIAIEMNKGFFEKNDIKPGSKIIFLPKL